MWSEWWNELWQKRRGTATGLAIGILLGLVYLICGFWNMLIFALIVLAGYYVGRKSDRGERILPWDEIYRWLSGRRDRFR